MKKKFKIFLILILNFLLINNFILKKKLNNISINFFLVPYPIINENLLKLYFLTFSSILNTNNNNIITILINKTLFDPNNLLISKLELKFGKNKIQFSQNIEVDENNIPYIDDWFHKSFDLSLTNFICLINSDIILPNNWYKIINSISEYFILKNYQFSIISRRCDFNLKDRKSVV